MHSPKHHNACTVCAQHKLVGLKCAMQSDASSKCLCHQITAIPVLGNWTPLFFFTGSWLARVKGHAQALISHNAHVQAAHGHSKKWGGSRQGLNPHKHLYNYQIYPDQGGDVVGWQTPAACRNIFPGFLDERGGEIAAGGRRLDHGGEIQNKI